MITYNDITVETYIRLLKEYQSLTDEDVFTQQCRLIAAVYNRTEDEIRNFPVGRFKEIWDDVAYLVNKKYDFPINRIVSFENTTYEIATNPFKFTVAQFADIEWVGANYEGLDRLIPTLALITTELKPARNKGGRPKVYYNGNERLSLLPIVSRFSTESVWGALDFFTKQLLLYATASRLFTDKMKEETAILMGQLTTLTTSTQDSIS